MSSSDKPVAKRKPTQKAHFNRPLTDRQERFCILMVLLGNAKEAYQQAGYPVRKDAIPGSTGIQVLPSQILGNPRIQRRIAFLKHRHGPRTKEDLLKFLGMTVTSPADGLPRVSDQVRATELIARLEGFFEPERVEHDIGKGLTSYLAALRGNNFGQAAIEMKRADVMSERYDSELESSKPLNINDDVSNE